MHSNFLRGAIAALALALAGFAQADALLKPLPPTDLSKLSIGDRQTIEGLRKQFDEAKGILVGPPLAEAFAKLAAGYGRYQLDEAALVALENAQLLAPDDGRYAYLHGFFNLKLARYPAARSDLERAAKLDSNYLPIRVRLADVMVQMDDLAGARATYSALVKDKPDLAAAHAGLGEVAMKEKKYADAIKHFEQALEADPRADSLYGRLADAAAASGDGPRAAALRAKAGYKPVAFADPLVAGIYAQQATTGTPVERALTAARKGEITLARAQLDEVLKQKADDVEALVAYARIELLAGNVQAAQSRADAALKAAPNDGGANLVAGFLYEVNADAKSATAAYAKAATVATTETEARVMLGNAYLRTKQYQPAIDAYRALAQKHPEDDDALARLVAAYAVAGQCVQGLATARAAHQARPRDGLAAQVFVRAASSCAKAELADKQAALTLAEALYKAKPSDEQAEALAMALAANGRDKDAVGYEGQVVFAAAKAQDPTAAEHAKALIKRFEAGQGAELPWAAGHPYVSPPSLAVKR